MGSGLGKFTNFANKIAAEGGAKEAGFFSKLFNRGANNVDEAFEAARKNLTFASPTNGHFTTKMGDYELRVSTKNPTLGKETVEGAEILKNGQIVGKTNLSSNGNGAYTADSIRWNPAEEASRAAKATTAAAKGSSLSSEIAKTLAKSTGVFVGAMGLLWGGVTLATNVADPRTAGSGLRALFVAADKSPIPIGQTSDPEIDKKLDGAAEWIWGSMRATEKENSIENNMAMKVIRDVYGITPTKEQLTDITFLKSLSQRPQIGGSSDDKKAAAEYVNTNISAQTSAIEAQAGNVKAAAGLQEQQAAEAKQSLERQVQNNKSTLGQGPGGPVWEFK